MSTRKKLVWLTLFGIGFGLVEAAVVVYLRNMYYPDGFSLLQEGLPADILRTEIFREAATIIMLIAMGILTGKTPLSRFSAFLVAFGVWDVFYYFWLKVFLGWPATVLDWDVLFLIPKPWVAPVLAPLLVCVGFIVCGSISFYSEERGPSIRVTPLDWTVEILAALVIITSFLVNSGNGADPQFPWWLFLLGLGGGIAYFFWCTVGIGSTLTGNE